MPPDAPAPDDEPQPSDSNYVQIEKRHIVLAFIPLAFLLGLGTGYLRWGRGQEAGSGTAASDTVQVGRITVDAGDDPAHGPEDAPITIIEFSDFNCPHCQRWHNEVSQSLFDTFPGQIRFVYKDFPIVGGGQAGFLAAQAAQCAGDQESYWEYHNAMFSGEYALDREGVDQAAADLGLDLDHFETCMVEAHYAEEVREDFEYGASLGISSTPTFFVNGIPLVGAQPLLNFIEIINGELSQ